MVASPVLVKSTCRKVLGREEGGECLGYGGQECPCVRKCLESDIRGVRFPATLRKCVTASPVSRGCEHHLAECRLQGVGGSIELLSSLTAL